MFDGVLTREPPALGHTINDGTFPGIWLKNILLNCFSVNTHAQEGKAEDSLRRGYRRQGGRKAWSYRCGRERASTYRAEENRLRRLAGGATAIRILIAGGPGG